MGEYLFLGQISLFGGTYVPKYYMLCNGQLLKIADYNDLFDLIGNRYGGDGRTTFALPKLPPKNKQMYIICTTGPFPVYF